MAGLQAAAVEWRGRGSDRSPNQRCRRSVRETVSARDLAGTVGGDAGADDDGHGHDLAGGVTDVEVGGVEVDVGNSMWPRVRNAATISSGPAQIRDTSDLEMAASTPIASTSSSTARVEMPRTYASITAASRITRRNHRL
jgi:hypothetical protein